LFFFKLKMSSIFCMSIIKALLNKTKNMEIFIHSFLLLFLEVVHIDQQ